VVWNGLRTGTFQVFSSDHAPFNLDDPKGKALHGKNASFSKIPNGIPGLETRLPLLFSAGVTQGQLSLARFVNLTSTYPARLYGLFPQKGVIAIGADADFAIWDPHATWTIANADLHHAVDYTPYEGITVTGRVTETVIRGRVVQRDGRLLVEKGSGQFLRCHAPDFDLM
jgi:dihydropyrimidinase